MGHLSLVDHTSTSGIGFAKTTAAFLSVPLLWLGSLSITNYLNFNNTREVTRYEVRLNKTDGFFEYTALWIDRNNPNSRYLIRGNILLASGTFFSGYSIKDHNGDGKSDYVKFEPSLFDKGPKGEYSRGTHWGAQPEVFELADRILKEQLERFGPPSTLF